MGHGRNPLYRVETDSGRYAFVFGRNRALQLSHNLKEGDVFEIPKAKKTSITEITKPSKTQKLEGTINNLLSSKKVNNPPLKEVGL